MNSKDIHHHIAEGNSAVEKLKEAICKVRTFLKMDKNAGKIMIKIDKPCVPGITSYRCAYVPHSKHM